MSKPRIESTTARNVSGLPAFDPVKLDLAVMLLIALGVTLVIARLNAPHWVELLTMAAVGLGSGAWVVLRARRAARTSRARVGVVHESRGGGNDP